MNIVDFMNGMTKESTEENQFSNKIAKRSEEKALERFSDDIVEDILRRISCKFQFINKGLSYGDLPKLSEEDTKSLTEKLKNQIKEIPGKLKTEIENVFGTSFDEPKKESEEKKESSVETVQQPVETPQVVPTASVSAFGY